MFSTPGLSLVRDFDNKSVFRIEPGDTAAPQDIQVNLAAPATAKAGAQLDLGLVLSNPTGKPMVTMAEDWQDFTLSYLDSSGNTVMAEPGTYRPPFFVDKGETTSISLSAPTTPPAGSYRARLHIQGGVLGERDFDFPLEVREMPDSKQPSKMSGEVAVSGPPGAIPSPDGLYPVMTVSVTNTGDTLWRSLLQDQNYNLPAGNVHLGMKWSGPNGALWEEQGCTIPSDVAPGQTVQVPVLTRPPNTPGTYRLDVGLWLDGTGFFGEMQHLDVQVLPPRE
jgi:hypothetical protein